jgi:hypothetical protein
MTAKLAFLACVSCGIGFAQVSQTGSSLHKKFAKPHQLRDLAIELQLSGWPVTFEEGPVTSADQLIGLTSPTGMPILVRRVQPMRVDLSKNEIGDIGNKARTAVIEHILSFYAARGNPDTYAVHWRGEYLEITPSTIMASDGRVQHVTPVLDTKIYFPEQRFGNLYDLVQAVINEVSQKQGISIVLGNTPSNLFRHSSVVEVAADEPAREVLAKAFAEINGPRFAEGLNPIALPWTLTYDSTNNQYWLDVNAIALRSNGMSAYGKETTPTTNNQPRRATPHMVQRQ